LKCGKDLTRFIQIRFAPIVRKPTAGRISKSISEKLALVFCTMKFRKPSILGIIGFLMWGSNPTLN